MKLIGKNSQLTFRRKLKIVDVKFNLISSRCLYNLPRKISGSSVWWKVHGTFDRVPFSFSLTEIEYKISSCLPGVALVCVDLFWPIEEEHFTISWLTANNLRGLTLSVRRRRDLVFSTFRISGAKPCSRICSDQNSYCLCIHFYVFYF